MKSLDQSLLPLSHLHHHDSRDVWAPFCNTWRSVKQRRKAARCDSGANHHNIKYDLKPYGLELWLGTLDYKNDQVPVGQFRYNPHQALELFISGAGYFILPHPKIYPNAGKRERENSPPSPHWKVYSPSYSQSRIYPQPQPHAMSNPHHFEKMIHSLNTVSTTQICRHGFARDSSPWI